VAPPVVVAGNLSWKEGFSANAAPYRQPSWGERCQPAAVGGGGLPGGDQAVDGGGLYEAGAQQAGAGQQDCGTQHADSGQ
jgi:hypothetical protein